MPSYDDDFELDMLAGEDEDEDVAIGADEIIGLEAIVGAAVSAALKKVAKARVLDPNAVAVKRKKLNARRRKPLPTAVVTIPAGEQRTITYATEELYRPERYVIGSTNITDFIIHDILVGTRSMFASTGEVPAEIFRPDAVDCNVHFDTANVGNKVKVVVENTNAADRDFRGVFLGTSLES